MADDYNGIVFRNSRCISIKRQFLGSIGYRVDKRVASDGIFVDANYENMGSVINHVIGGEFWLVRYAD